MRYCIATFELLTINTNPHIQYLFSEMSDFH